MLKSVAALLVVVVAVSLAAKVKEQLPQGRFFIITETIVKPVISATTTTVTVPSTCARLVNVTGACRRRRGIDELPEAFDFDPSPVEPIEASAAPEPAHDKLFSEAAFLSSGSVLPELRSSASLPEEVEIIGLDSDCFRAKNQLSLINPASRFLTLVFSTTAVATVTVTTTVTAGSKAFNISGCTPTPFTYKLC